MNNYDPDIEPNPEAWLELFESDRLELVMEFHAQLEDDLEDTEDEIPNMEMHCGMHVVVENQLAMDSPPLARKTMSRLMEAGVSRHDAMHAIANAMTQEMFLMLKSDEMFNEERYEKALQELDPSDWISF
jgi:hypothetical protein